jgi:hypothetical protein
VYYILQFKKKDSVDLETFRTTVRASLEWWAENNPQDELLLLAGRTMRLGPAPGYIAVWKLSGLARLEEWLSGTREKLARPDVPTIVSVADFVHGGLYEDLGEEVP